MGCHTWFYKKVNRTCEEGKKIWIDNQERFIKDWEEIANNPNDDCRIAYDWSQEYLDWNLKVFKRQLQVVKKGLCGNAVMNNQPCDNEHYLYRYINNTLYGCNDNLPHDTFRIGNYPKDVLFSKKECFNFIKENKEKINYYNPNWEEQLNKFWEQYPDGMICFG
jgi:hypothetical protein